MLQRSWTLAVGLVAEPKSVMLSGGGLPRVSVGVPSKRRCCGCWGDCGAPPSAALAIGGTDAGNAGSPRTRLSFLGCRHRSRNILCFHGCTGELNRNLCRSPELLFFDPAVIHRRAILLGARTCAHGHERVRFDVAAS